MRRPLLSGVLLLGLAAAAACSDSPTTPTPRGSIHKDIGIGELVRLNVNEAETCTNPDYRIGRVVAKSARAVILADTTNPKDGLTEADYRAIAQTFDDLVYPTVTRAFGEPSDIDGNGRIAIFYTRKVNELTPQGQGWFVGGFFYGRDLFPQQKGGGFEACPGSNYAEMLYMLVADPSGEVHGNPRSRELVLNSTVGVLGHELQHLINASRRLYVTRLTGRSWNEEVWLNEGLSHIAEELIGHEAGSTAPRQNLDAARVGSEPARTAFNRYHASNFGRLHAFLERPDTTTALDETGGLAARGAVWAFLRYAVDRSGGSETAFWKSLVDSNQIGMANLQGAIGGADPLLWLRDWMVALHTDDAVPGVAAAYQQPSWNFRSVFPSLRVGNEPLGQYPLRTIRPTPGVETQVELRGGGGAHVRFGVAPGARGEVRIAGAAPSCAPGAPAVTLGVGEAHAAAGDAARSLCLSGGTTGAEFVWVPFHASATAGSRLVLGVTTLGTVPALGPPSPSRAATGPLSLAVAGARAPLPVGPQPSPGWEAELREREVRELSRLVPGGAARTVRSTAAASTAASDVLHVVVVRTK